MNLLLAVPLALAVGAIMAIVDWDLNQPRRWSAETEAYEQRCRERDMPVDRQAWLDAYECARRVTLQRLRASVVAL